MTWRGSTAPLDRVIACLVYLLPLMDAIIFYSGYYPFGGVFFREFDELRILVLPLTPLLTLYLAILRIFSFGGIGLGGLLIFFGLYFFVVRNEKIQHFIRFNTMQAIMIGIATSIFSVIWAFMLQPILGGTLIEDTLFNVIFLGTVAIVVYSVVQSVLGKYAEIPTLSDAVYMQVR
jgi:uncharacterized membrane protein